MSKSAAERMAESRARKRGELPELPRCSVCGKIIKDSGTGRALAAGVCFKHWAESEEGKAFTAEARKLRRQKQTGPKPFRYYGSLPGEEAWPEGPFNRLRLAISSSYAGKGKPRGKIWIVWNDDVVTEHVDVKQSDVGAITRDDGREVDRDDLTELAKSMPPLTERVRHYGHTDVYLV